ACTTGSPSPTWSHTTTSTTRPTASPTVTEPATTAPGTAAPKAPPPTQPSSVCADGSRGQCWRPCCCRSACRYYLAGTSAAAPSRGTTTPTATHTKSPC